MNDIAFFSIYENLHYWVSYLRKADQTKDFFEGLDRFALAMNSINIRVLTSPFLSNT